MSLAVCTFDEWAEAQAMNAREVADLVNTLYRRIAVLENVIAENYEELSAGDLATAEVILDVMKRRGPVELH